MLLIVAPRAEVADLLLDDMERALTPPGGPHSASIRHDEGHRADHS